MTAVDLERPTDREFRRLWCGESVSILGNATSSILLPLLAVVGLHAGAFAMGLLTAAAWLPWLVVGLPAGAAVDRMSPRAVMIAADLAAAAALGSVPVAWGLGVLTIEQLVVVALVSGTCTVYFRAAYPSLVKRIVSAEQLTSANARMTTTESALQVVGPGIGGWLAGVVGAAAGVLLDVISFLVSAVCLWRLRVPARAHPATATAESLRDRIGAGLRTVYGDRYLRWFTVLGGISNFGLTGYGAILVLFLVRSVGLAPGGVGLLLALSSLGGVAGAAIASRLSAAIGSARAVIVLQLIAGPPAVLLAFATPGGGSTFVVVSMSLVGFGVVGGNVIKTSFRMRYVPAELLGRAITAAQLVNFGTMPVAALVAGWLGGTIGLRETVFAMAAVHAVASLAVLLSPVTGRRDLPTNPAIVVR